MKSIKKVSTDFGTTCGRGLVSVTATAAVLMSGCAGGSAPANTENTTLTMMASSGSSGDTFTALAERFTEDTGIKVDIELLPIQDVRQQQLLGLTTGSSDFDVVTVNDPWIVSFSPFLESLDDRIAGDPSTTEDLIPAHRELYSFEGTQYALPSRGGGVVLAYRKDLLEQAGFDGPPTTWDEFRDYAEALNDPSQNLYGAGLTLAQSTFLLDTWGAYLISSGGSYVTEEGKLVGAIDSAVAVEATREMAAMYQDGIIIRDSIEYQDSEIISAMQQGRVAMSIIASSWFGKIADPSLSEFADQFAIAPHLPGVGDAPPSRVSGWGFGINESSEHKDEAWRFVEYAASAEAQKYLASSFNNEPTNATVYEDPEYLAANPQAPAVLSSFEGAKQLPSIAGWDEVYLELQSVISSIVVGNVSAEEGLHQAAKDLQGMLG